MPSRFFRRSRAVLTGLALCGAATAVLPAASGAASAAPVPSTGVTATVTTGYYTFSAQSDGLYLDIQGGSKAKNGLVVQWTPTGTASEIWHVGRNGQIRNLNSGMCLTTDGLAGQQLFQWPCQLRYAAQQQWDVFSGNGVVAFVNPDSSLFVDVYGNNTTLGGPIDGWPNNGGYPNQTFVATPVIVDGAKG